MGIMMLNNKVLMSGNQMALYVPPSPLAKGGDYNIVQTNDGDNCSLAITDANTFVLTTKTITENGTYNASDDNADGYSQVTVNVASGGGSGGVETCKLTINVITPPSNDPEWSIDIYPAILSDSAPINLNANNQSAEIVLPENGMFAMSTSNTINYVDTSDWGIFDEVGVANDYVYNPAILRTYICYAGETGNGTWDIVFR